MLIVTSKEGETVPFNGLRIRIVRARKGRCRLEIHRPESDTQGATEGGDVEMPTQTVQPESGEAYKIEPRM